MLRTRVRLPPAPPLNHLTEERTVKITRRQLKRIIKEEYNKLKWKGLIREAMGPLFAVDVEEPGMQAEDMDMSFGEYIKLYIDAAKKAGVNIVENTPDMFTVHGTEDAIVEFGFQVNQMTGGPSFSEEEFREYAMYRV